MIDYYLITKPGIIIGNLVTLLAGYLIATKGYLDPQLLMVILTALAFIVASACIFNNYIDRNRDKLMNRTKKRPIAAGRIGKKQAVALALACCFIGNLIFLLYTNLLTLFFANLGLFIYVCLYSMWKGDTIYGTAIGSLAGALPPVIGYTAVTNSLDLGAILLFFLLVMWQMPHFFSIAIMHIEDYTRAKIPVLPVEKGVKRARNRMLLYILGCTTASMLLFYYNYTGYWFLWGSVGASFFWLAFCFFGYQQMHSKLWAKRMFRYSLFVISTVTITILLDCLHNY